MLLALHEPYSNRRALCNNQVVSLNRVNNDVLLFKLDYIDGYRPGRKFLVRL